MMMDMHLKPITKSPFGCLNLPGSKSIANRVLPLAAISHGESIIHNIPSNSEDVGLMLKALQNLGVEIVDITDSCASFSASSNNSIGTTINSYAKTYKIIGCGGDFAIKNALIFCGNSGTTIRFLTAILALMPGQYCLDGINRMHERPIKDLVVALQQIGAQIEYKLKDGYPPLQTNKFIDNYVKVIKISGKISSQYLTGLLMALPLLQREVTVQIIDELVSRPYVMITEALLAKFGCGLIEQDNSYIINKDVINGGDTAIGERINNTDIQSCQLTGINYTVEPDASSASYFLAMAAICGDIRINHLSKNSLQGDKNFADILAQMGADVSYDSDSVWVKSKTPLNAIKVNMEDMPDVAMTIAVMALFAEGTTTITGIHSWKVKETDRLVAMYNELTKLGADVTITDSSISITPPQQITANVSIETYNDHRMAMCFSLVAVYGIPIIIKDYMCVGKTFPDYFDVFHSLCY